MNACSCCNEDFKTKETFVTLTNEDFQTEALVFCTNKCRVQYHLNELNEDDFRTVVLESIKTDTRLGFDRYTESEIALIEKAFNLKIDWSV